MRALRVIALGAALGVVALSTPAGALGAGATYDVVHCHPLNRASDGAKIRDRRPYSVTKACTASKNPALRIDNVLPARASRKGSIRWRAPEGTAIVAVRASAQLRRAAGHVPTLAMADAQGRETRRVATGGTDAGPFKAQKWSGNGQKMFMATLGCKRASGCPQSNKAKMWLRNVRLTLADYVDPELAVSGSLLSGGWKRGEQVIGLSSSDVGSGLVEASLNVNGQLLEATAGACDGAIPGSPFARTTSPCSGALLQEAMQIDTESVLFVNGSNQVAVCSADFSGNQSCRTRAVMVDNASPSIAFVTAQILDDPELVQVSVQDPHSGVTSGQIAYRAEGASVWQPLETAVTSGKLKARVDSTAVPPGVYEFRAEATDVAGNEAATTLRQDGHTMRLSFPLKSGVKLNAHLEPGGAKRMTIPYGRRSRVAGVLRSAAGDPLADQEIVIEEYFGEGALIRERISRVQTDQAGRWQLRLPRGPSRQVTAHYAGTKRYLSQMTLGGRLAVRTKASLRTSRRRVLEGKRVVFRGRLGRLGASIPPGGKLLELQVKQDTNKYQTVGEGFRSKPSGRFRVGYRFGRFYQYNVRFKFRVKVAREADWPYKAPARSKVKTVTVLDR